MHYYQFNIADYRKDTGHLTLLEHGIYRQLLDTYYLDEKPIETQSVIRRLSIKTQDEKEAFENVIGDFFVLSDCGNHYNHSRSNTEISKYHDKAKTARVNGGKGGRPKKPRKTQPVNLGSENKPRRKLTTNHKPLTTNKDKPLSAKPDRATEIFDCWVATMGKSKSTTKLTPKRKKAIQGRLTDGYTLDQILTAILNCKNDPWSMGENDRQTPFNDIELICRTGEKLESFIDKKSVGGNHAQNRSGRNSSANQRKPTPAERVAIAHAERYGGDPAGDSPNVDTVVSVQ